MSFHTHNGAELYSRGGCANMARTDAESSGLAAPIPPHIGNTAIAQQHMINSPLPRIAASFRREPKGTL
jgi:hypothetical protein